MGKHSRRRKHSFLKRAFPEPNKDFKDLEERYRLFNNQYKAPKLPNFIYISVTSIVLTIIPLCNPSSIYNTVNIVMLIVGVILSVGFEQTANLLYSRFARIANTKNYQTVIWHVRLNKILRIIAMMSWIITVFALTTMMFTNSGSISEIW